MGVLQDPSPINPKFEIWVAVDGTSARTCAKFQAPGIILKSNFFHPHGFFAKQKSKRMVRNGGERMGS
jgi:hypothetical protein